MSTDFSRMEGITIPKDLSISQIYELFQKTTNLSYYQMQFRTAPEGSGRKQRLQRKLDEAIDDLTGWYMAQNFHNQVSNPITASTDTERQVLVEKERKRQNTLNSVIDFSKLEENLNSEKYDSDILFLKVSMALNNSVKE